MQMVIIHTIKSWFTLGRILLFAAPVLMLAALSGGSWVIFGSPDAAFCYLRGERVLVHPSIGLVDLPSSDSTARVTFKVNNLSGTPMKLVGAKTFCTCVLVNQLPTTIEPWGHYDLEVVVRPKVEGEAIEQSLILYTDNGWVHSVPLSVRSRRHRDAGAGGERSLTRSIAQ